MSHELRISRRAALGTLTALAATAASGWPADSPTLPGRVGPILPRPKLTLFFTRAEGIARDTFFAPWMDQLVPRLIKAPGLASLTINSIDYVRTMDSPYDGVAEMEFDGVKSLDAFRTQWTASAAGQDALAKNTFTMVTWQVVIRPIEPKARATASAKRIGIVGHPDYLTRDKFIEEWRDIHAPEVDHPKGLVGYILNVTDPGRSSTSPFDGYAELWWPDWTVQGVYQVERTAMKPDLGFFREGPHLLVLEKFHKVF